MRHERTNRIVRYQRGLFIQSVGFFNVANGIHDSAVSIFSAFNHNHIAVLRKVFPKQILRIGNPLCRAQNDHLLKIVIDDKFLYCMNNNRFLSNVQVLLRTIHISHSTSDATCQNNAVYHFSSSLMYQS